jgi:mono/diheme cytochrome c family protein
MSGLCHDSREATGRSFDKQDFPTKHLLNPIPGLNPVHCVFGPHSQFSVTSLSLGHDSLSNIAYLTTQFERLADMISGFSNTKQVSIIWTLMLAVGMGQDSKAEEIGEQTFQTHCATCHTIGGGRLVGPDLAGVTDKRSQEWLQKFIKSSQTVINSGDADAIALFDEYNKLPMPDPPVTDSQIGEILVYIQAASLKESGSDREVQPVVVADSEPASEADVARGRELFQGTIKFANQGPTCNACHDVKNDAVIGGGILAAELTKVFSRMGGPGVRAILGSPPFPVMQAAYKDKALTKDEIASLISFLQHADKEQFYQQPRDYGVGLFLSGAGGTVIVYLLSAFFWRGRKRGSVNQTIFDRQIRSVKDW